MAPRENATPPYWSGALSVMVGLLFLTGECAGGMIRVWRPKVSRFEQRDTWHPPRQPCFGDTVQLQENRAILISKHHTLSGLTLPSKGELIFAHDAVLEIVDLSETTYQQLDGCPAQPPNGPLLSSITPRSWFDPANWQTHSAADGQERQQIFLDSERIPCNGDDVQLPAGHTFQIGMPSGLQEAILLNTFQVGPLFLTDQTLALYFTQPHVKSTAVFDAAGFLNRSQSGASDDPTAYPDTSVRDEVAWSTRSGSFIKIGRRNLAQWPCDAQYGCKCANDRKEMMEQICQFVSAANGAAAAVVPSCQEPIRIEGRCQPICGSVVRVKTTSAAQAMETLRRVQSTLEELRESDEPLPTVLRHRAKHVVKRHL